MRTLDRASTVSQLVTSAVGVLNQDGYESDILMSDSLLDYFRRLEVWYKGKPAAGRDPAEWRIDDYGNLIRFSDYGDRNSPYGWEIDHHFPSVLGGGDGISNLRPLHCRKNASLGGILSGMR